MMARSHDTERYRKAAHMTLDQLDWCVKYLRSLHKTKLSAQIEKNRAEIASRLEPRHSDRPPRS
jgi:hypothetical protein